MARLSLPPRNDLETLNAQLDLHNYRVMRRSNGTLALYRILRGFAIADHDALQEIRKPSTVPLAVRSMLGLKL